MTWLRLFRGGAAAVSSLVPSRCPVHSFAGFAERLVAASATPTFRVAVSGGRARAHRPMQERVELRPQQRYALRVAKRTRAAHVGSTFHASLLTAYETSGWRGWCKCVITPGEAACDRRISLVANLSTCVIAASRSRSPRWLTVRERHTTANARCSRHVCERAAQALAALHRASLFAPLLELQDVTVLRCDGDRARHPRDGRLKLIRTLGIATSLPHAGLFRGDLGRSWIADRACFLAARRFLVGLRCTCSGPNATDSRALGGPPRLGGNAALTRSRGLHGAGARREGTQTARRARRGRAADAPARARAGRQAA